MGLEPPRQGSFRFRQRAGKSLICRRVGVVSLSGRGGSARGNQQPLANFRSGKPVVGSDGPEFGHNGSDQNGARFAGLGHLGSAGMVGGGDLFGRMDQNLQFGCKAGIFDCDEGVLGSRKNGFGGNSGDECGDHGILSHSGDFDSGRLWEDLVPKVEGEVCASADRGELGLEELKATGLETEGDRGGVDSATGVMTELFGKIFAHEQFFKVKCVGDQHPATASVTLPDFV